MGLFAERGYDAVSMDTIATELGISRRSLFRYFASKADLVWDGVDPATEEFRRQLDHASMADSPLDAFTTAYVAGVTSTAVDWGMARTRLRIIAAHTDLQVLGPPRLLANSDAIVGFLEKRLPELAGTVQLVAVADALSACCYAALRFWATSSDDETPGETIRQALAAFGTFGRS